MGGESLRLKCRDVGLIAALFVGVLLTPMEPRPSPLLAELGRGRLGSEGRTSYTDDGLLRSLPGGLRRLVAGYCWIRTYAAWEAGDGSAVIAGLEQTTRLDPGALHFWINGARMIAHDLPRWKLDTLGGEQSLPRAVCTQVQEEHAQAALRLLARAETFHPMTAVLAIEAGTLHWHGRRDLAAAVDAFERAMLCDDAPFYAFRIHAELLRMRGRPRDAYRSLCRFLSERRPWMNPNLSGVQSGFPDHPSASFRGRGDPQVEVVLKRIRQLEQELEIDPGQSFEYSGSRSK